MRIKAYLIFPESEDDFIRIGETAKPYEDLIGEVAVIKQQLKKYKDFELCYDSGNVNVFLTKAEQLIGGEYLANCRAQLEIIFGNNVRNVSTTFLNKADCIYVNWNINRTLDDSKKIIAEAAEAKYGEGENKTILINISNAYMNNRDSVHVIKDAVHYNELPVLISIPIVNNEIEFSEWISSLTSAGFSLRDKVRFEKTAYRWKKQGIFREKATGRYWYYDYFHKDNVQHYEVFGADGRNLGISNTQGVLDTSKVKDERRIDNIIQ